MADEQELDHEQRAELRKRLAYLIICAFEKWIEGYYPKAVKVVKMSKTLYYTVSLRAPTCHKRKYTFPGRHPRTGEKIHAFTIRGRFKAYNVCALHEQQCTHLEVPEKV
jgi:hypothetical protein